MFADIFDNETAFITGVMTEKLLKEKKEKLVRSDGIKEILNLIRVED